MSGGSLDYVYGRVEDASSRIAACPEPDRRAFAQHLLKVAAALRAIEWNLSGDGDDSEAEAIKACLAPGAVMEVLIADARSAHAALRAALDGVR